MAPRHNDDVDDDDDDDEDDDGLNRRHDGSLQWSRRIAHLKWQDHIPNTEVLQICSISGNKAFLISAQLR